MSPRVVVVGGGVTGLAAAFRLRDEGVEVVVLERDPAPGGKVRSAEVGGLALEAGPDSLLARKPWAVDLVRALGMGEDLIPASPAPAHIWTRSGLHRFPAGPLGISTDPWELARWGGMTPAARLRAAADLVLPRGRPAQDESLGALLRRRIGNGATDALVAPLLGGLFAGDVDRLSVAATFPELAVWEREHGSLMRGARAAARRARASAPSAPAAPSPAMFLRLRGGLVRLTGALAARLGDDLRTGVGATRVRPTGAGFAVRAADDDIEADAVVLAVPAPDAARLLDEPVPVAAGLLRGIVSASTAVALLVYPDGTGDRVPDSSGFVAPRGVLPMNAATFVSKKWPAAAFGDRAVVRCFVGGAGTDGLMGAEDGQVLAEVMDALARIVPLPAVAEAAAVVRWPSAMPQYEVGHLERVDAIEAALPPGLVVAGQSYRGAGLPDCVRQGTGAADRVLAGLA